MNITDFLSIPLKKINRISPSRYQSMNLCKLKEIWASNKKPLLLPQHPTAYLGTAIHAILEMTFKSEISNIASSNQISPRNLVCLSLSIARTKTNKIRIMESLRGAERRSNPFFLERLLRQKTPRNDKKIKDQIVFVQALSKFVSLYFF